MFSPKAKAGAQCSSLKGKFCSELGFFLGFLFKAREKIHSLAALLPAQPPSCSSGLPSSLPEPPVFSRNISVCRVPLSTSFLTLCKERKDRDAWWNTSNGQNAGGPTLQGQGSHSHQNMPFWTLNTTDKPNHSLNLYIIKLKKQTLW